MFTRPRRASSTLPTTSHYAFHGDFTPYSPSQVTGIRKGNSKPWVVRWRGSPQGLESALSSEILDKTGLTGRYDFDVKWNGQQPTSIMVGIRDQLGLELVIERRNLKHLVVDFAEETKTW